MLTAADASALPPLPLLMAAVVVLLALGGSLVVLGRRRRAGHGEAVEDAAEEVAGSSPDEDPLPEDPRTLRLLVRSLEAALEELSVDGRQPEPAAIQPEPAAIQPRPAVLRPEPESELLQPEPTAVEPGPTTATARRVGLIGAALAGVDEGDRAARLDAALQRSRAPRSFTRPALAACVDTEVPAVLVARTAPDAPVPGAPVADDTPEDVVAPPATVVEPAEPERVLPVPADPVPDAAPRRRLFGRRVA